MSAYDYGLAHVSGFEFERLRRDELDYSEIADACVKLNRKVQKEKPSHTIEVDFIVTSKQYVS